MTTTVLQTNSPTETWSLGKIIAKLLLPGDVICLNGDLGAGKTALSQGIAAGLGINEPVTSPTFTLINEYQGGLPLYHFDVYRLGGPEDMEDLGYEEYFYGQGVCLIEWANLVKDVLPAERLEISIVPHESLEEVRIVNILPMGSRYHLLVEELKKLVCFRD